MVARAERTNTLVKRTTLDAPHITRAEVDALAAEMGGWDSISARRELLCELVVDETRAIVPEWVRHAEGCTKVTPAREHRFWWVSADLGYRDGTAILLGWVDWYDEGGPVLVVEDERILRRPTSHDVAEAAAQMEREHDAGKVRGRVADAPPITVADLRRLQRHQDTPEQYWRVPRKDDLDGAVNHLRLLVKRGRIAVNPRCKVLLADLRAGVWDEKREAFQRIEDKSESGAVEVWHFDALAALVYLVRSVDMVTSPEPSQWVPGPARHPPPGDMSQGTLPSRPGGRVHLGRKRR